jgi:hypothetical protein
MVEKVGIILVHGIGEQRRFEHLESHARDLLKALNKREARTGEPTQSSIEVIEAPGAPFKAEQTSWATSPSAAVHAMVYDGNEGTKREIHLYFHEVWYADIGENFSIGKQLRFWAWGLSMWTLPRKLSSSRPAYENMREPKANIPVTTQLLVRLQLFFVGVVSVLASFSLTPFIFLFTRLFNTQDLSFVKLFVNYVSMVKLYNQHFRRGGNPLDALPEPPRSAIRRRMVRTIIDVATSPRKYDRWYILAHSLGSVIAFNGLMEPEEILPNYLDEKRWKRVKNAGMVSQVEDQSYLKLDLCPSRPLWVDPNSVIKRRELFCRFRGFLTYGCPLDKFAILWPARVPINKDESVFQDGVEWINVYDVTDPVAGYLDYFNPTGPAENYSCLKPRNLGYKASFWVLISHIRYHRLGRSRGQVKDKNRALADFVVEWLLKGSAFPVDSKNKPKQWSRWWLDPQSSWDKWRMQGRRVCAFVQWIAVVLLLLILAAEVLHWPIALFPSWVEMAVDPLLYTGISNVSWVSEIYIKLSLWMFWLLSLLNWPCDAVLSAVWGLFDQEAVSCFSTWTLWRWSHEMLAVTVLTVCLTLVAGTVGRIFVYRRDPDDPKRRLGPPNHDCR